MLGLLVAIAGCAYTDPYADADPRHTPKKGATSCVTEKKNPIDNYELKFKCTLRFQVVFLKNLLSHLFLIDENDYIDNYLKFTS